MSGFLPQDILKEVRRSLLLSCVVCGRRGASIGCAVKRCRCVGHYSCLQNSGYIFQHFDNFKAFCPKHSPTQRAVKLSQSDCPVCLEAINAEPGFHQISCPHCKTYFHRSCIQVCQHQRLPATSLAVSPRPLPLSYMYILVPRIMPRLLVASTCDVLCAVTKLTLYRRC